MNKVPDDLRDKRRQETASRIAEQMRNGTAVWQQSYNQAADKNFIQPYNPVSGYKVNGYNMVELFSHKESQEKIGPVEVFTFAEANSENWKIRKGAKSIALENYLKIDMGYEKIIDEKTGGTKNQFYKKETDKPILYNYPVFTLKDLQNEHEVIKSTSAEITPKKAIDNLLKNTGIKLVIENGLKKSFYAPKRDEIHVSDTEINDSKQSSKLLRHVIRAAGKAGRAFSKDVEGFSSQHSDLSYVKNKFRIEIATMQAAMRTGLPYEPAMTEFENKQIAGLIERKPINLVIMANEASRIANYVISNTNEKSKEKTLDEVINEGVKMGKMSDRQLSDSVRKMEFKEFDGKSDIKKRHIINEKIKQAKSKSQDLSR